MNEIMEKIITKQRDFFNTDKTKDVKFRLHMLKILYEAIKANEQNLYAALKADLNKCEAESYLTEIQMVLSEISVAKKNLARWQAPRRVKTPITHFPAKSVIYHEPFGVVLILSPWNYPVQLALAPLVGAIAGGNCVVIKTSKSSQHVSNVIKKMLTECFPQKYVYCVSDEYSYDDILLQKYDLIFFTGSERVGKIVMEAASKNITPIILELGGKSPCIVDKTADISLAAKRIAWGKFLNAGQTCVAPDYVYVEKTVLPNFIVALKSQISLLYDKGDGFLNNPDYPKIITQQHFERLTSLISNHKNKIFGISDIDTLKIEPTIFLDVNIKDEIMKDEIFGPILPILPYENLDDIINEIKSRPKPLACYIFSNSKTTVSKITNGISFGSGCVNDVIMQLANHHLPFGGVGESGMGNYHGYTGFKTFTREKGMLHNSNLFDIPFRYPPYTERQLKFLRKITSHK